MKNHIGIICVIFTLLVSNLSIVSLGEVESNQNKTIYVDDDGGADYTKIQDAIDNASDGDTIYVYSGTYFENVYVNKSVFLIGQDRNNTIVDANFIGDVFFLVKDNIHIESFTIQNSGKNKSETDDVGIEISSNNNSIKDNIFSNNNYGIYIFKGINNIIQENFIHKNDVHGIWIKKNNILNRIYNNIIEDNEVDGIQNDGKNNSIISNIIFNCSVGISVGSSRNYVYSNHIENCKQGIDVWGNNIITNNRICDYRDKGILIYSGDSNISNNYIEGNFDNIGIDINSYNNILFNNTICNNLYGIDFDSKDTNISKNKFINNIIACFTGRISYSRKNVFFMNYFENNNLAIYMPFTYIPILDNMCKKYRFINNDFIGNDCIVNVYTGNHFWNGNYWGRPRSFPKVIFHFATIAWIESMGLPYRIQYPSLEFDMNPAKEPYDIEL